jgi:hypothetical protein
MQATFTRLHPHALPVPVVYVVYPAARQKERKWAAGYKADMTVGWTVTELLGGLTEREMSGGKTIRYPAPPAGNELEKPNQQCCTLSFWRQHGDYIARRWAAVFRKSLHAFRIEQFGIRKCQTSKRIPTKQILITI